MPDNLTQQIAELMNAKPVQENEPQTAGSDSSAPGADAGDADAEHSEPVAAEADTGGTGSDPAGDDDAGAEAAEPGTGEGDQPGDEPAAGERAVFEFEALAEKAGVTVPELYQVEIPLSDGLGTMKLGEIKDRYADLQRVDNLKTELDNTRREQENDFMVARQELETIVSMMGGQVTPELVELARQQRNTMVKRERDAIMSVLPEWQDPETLAREREQINETLQSYGFREIELQNVYDHRLLKFARDAVQLMQRAKTATAQLEEARERKAPSKPGRKNNRSQAARKAHMMKKAKEGGRAAKVAAVKELIAP